MVDNESKEDKEDMLACAKRSITDLDSDIARLSRLRDTWLKIVGKLEGELYGRIKP
jgi:hypothetical protein